MNNHLKTSTGCIDALPEEVAARVRRPPVVEEWHGLQFLVNHPMHLADGRVRTKVVLVRPGTKKGAMEERIVHAATEEELDVRVRQAFFSMAYACMDELWALVRDGTFKSAPFALYRTLKRDDVCRAQKWAGQAELYDLLWRDRLKGCFGAMPMTEVASKVGVKKRRDVLFHHQGHRQISNDERMCWIQLSGFVGEMVRDRLVTENPLKSEEKKHERSQSEKALKALSARSFSREELLTFVQLCLAEADASIGRCMLLRVLLGVSVYEVCGLNLGSYAHGKDLSWLEIEREYYQKRGKKPFMREMLNSVNQYRKVVCSDVAEWIVSQQFKKRQQEGAERTDPLFVQAGERLQPDVLKKKEEALIDAAMKDGIHIALKARGRKRRMSRDRARTDILRGTVSFNLRHVAKMTQPQVAAMFGIDRVSTYAVWYVDWNNLETLRYMKRKLNAWHNEVLVVQKGKKMADLPNLNTGENQGILLCGIAEPGACIEARAECGVMGSVQQMSKSGGYDVRRK